MKTQELPDSEVQVKLSTCPTCKGMVECAIEHKMDERSRKDFYRSAAIYQLDI